MLIVETGDGSSTANTYVSLADADAFHTARGNTAWGAAGQAYREAALINATDYIDANYIAQSCTVSSTQALVWPRVNTTYNVALTGVPAAIRKAVSLLALEALAGPLGGAQPQRDVVATKQSLEGVGSTEITYSDARQSRYPTVDALMSTLGSGRRGSAIRSIQVTRL